MPITLYESGADEKKKKPKLETTILEGVVVNNCDPAGQSKVLVRIPSLNQEVWARMSSPGAGSNAGLFYTPRPDDEVLVAFDHGDISNPYVLGALWNGEDAPPETNSDGQNNIRKIKSRSGHEIIFDDTQAQEKIEINTNAGHKILLDDTSGQEKIEIVDKTGSNSIKIDSVANNVNVESAMQLKIKAQMIEIESGTTMTIKAGATLTLQGAVIQIN